jgi:flagellar biosynthetic protein FliP
MMRNKIATPIVFFVVVLGCLWAPQVVANPADMSLTLSSGADGSQMSAALKIVLFLTVLAFAPAILVCMTSFTRIVVVLSFIRQALGTQNTPPNQVMVGIALFLTLFTMAPTASKIHTRAVQPFMDKEISETEAFAAGVDVMKTFLLRHTRQTDLELFYEISAAERPDGPLAIPLRILVPAFVLSELKTAFEMGFLVFVPFLLIDMVIASILMAMGMMMLPPVLIAMPFKILLFVLVDGWHLLIGSLARSFA